MLRTALRVLLVHGAAYAASRATELLGSAENRTTNSMAYPALVSAVSVARTRRFYASAQFGATAMAVSGSPTLAFWPLCAIELAPLMMTMVRKNIASTRTYHRVYTAALCVPYTLCAYALACRLRESSPFEPELLRHAVSPALVSARLAHSLRVSGATKHAALGVYGLLMGVAECFDCKVRTFKWDSLFFAGMLLSLIAIPAHDVRWMFARLPPGGLCSTESTRKSS